MATEAHPLSLCVHVYMCMCSGYMAVCDVHTGPPDDTTSSGSLLEAQHVTEHRQSQHPA